MAFSESQAFSRSSSLKRTLTLNSTLFHRFIRSFLFPVHSSTNVLDEDMKRLSVCTSVDGMDVRRLMAP